MPTPINVNSINQVIEDVYCPALNKEMEARFSQFLEHTPILPVSRRTRIRFWRVRTISNVKDAWHVLWYGPDKFMDY